jgi:hypothetical protein
VAARLEHGSGSLEPGLARVTWTVFDEVSPYGHVASRGTHLGGLRAARGGRRRVRDGGFFVATLAGDEEIR